MDVTIVDDDSERAVVKRVLDGHANMSDGDIPREEWDDRTRFPRRQWLMFEEGVNGRARFTVVDNREGQCFVEEFKTLDGAMLYLCECYMTTEHQDDWDFTGAVRDHGGFFGKEAI